MSNPSTYIGVFLDKNSQGLLGKLRTFVPKDWVWFGEHLTITFFGKPLYPEDFPAPYNKTAEENKKVSLVVTHIGITDKAIAVRVTGLPVGARASHITLATPNGENPKASNLITNWKKIRGFTLHGVIAGDGDAEELINEGNIIDPSLVKTANDVATGHPITLHYIKNPEKAPKMGIRFGQDVEPSGFYATQKEYDNNNWQEGTIDFKNPLVIDVNDDTLVQWKYELSKHMRGLKNKELTKALQDRGYDGIITRNPSKGWIGEIIAFRNATVNQSAQLHETEGFKRLYDLIKKTNSFSTPEGKFSVYDMEKHPIGRGDMFTVWEHPDGWIVRNAFLPDDLQQQNIASIFYQRMNAASYKATGKPLRSTQARTLNSGEVIHELSPLAIKLWDRMVRWGQAKKLGDKNYVFNESLMQEEDVTSDTVIPMGPRWNDQMDGGDYDMQVWAAPTQHVKYGGSMTEQIVKRLVKENLNVLRREHAGWILPNDTFVDSEAHIDYLLDNYPDEVDALKQSGGDIPQHLYALAYAQGLVRVYYEGKDRGFAATSVALEADSEPRIKHLLENHYYATLKDKTVNISIFVRGSKRSHTFYLPQDKEEFAQYVFGGTLSESIETIKSLLSSDKVFDIHFSGQPSNDGWKLSIIGKNMANVLELTDRLHSFLESKSVAHKIATLKRLNHPDPYQSKKLMTIYVPNGTDVKVFAGEIENLMAGYTGWHDIKTPPSYEHYSNGIFFRNDRDADGNYVPANQTESVIKKLTLKELASTFPWNVGGADATYDSWTDHAGDANNPIKEISTADVKPEVKKPHKFIVTPQGEMIVVELHLRYFKSIFPNMTSYRLPFEKGYVRGSYDQYATGSSSIPSLSIQGTSMSTMKSVVKAYLPILTVSGGMIYITDEASHKEYSFTMSLPSSRAQLNDFLETGAYKSLWENKIMLETEHADISKLPFILAIEKAGGKVYQVGGAVRDEFLKRTSKDLDIMVAGMTAENLIEVLKKFGNMARKKNDEADATNVNFVGGSFAVVKFKPFGDVEDIDIALARQDIQTGTRYKDIKPHADPSITLDQDLARRDFTINAISKDTKGQIHDPFNGREDLKNKVIRMVSPTAFSEDPVRMLRAVQFASRFHFDIEPATYKAIKDNAAKVAGEDGERLDIEFNKMVHKGNPTECAKLLVDSGLYKAIFQTDFKGDFNDFKNVTRDSEFFFLLTKDSLSHPNQYWAKRFKGNGEIQKEIEAFELTRGEFNTPAEKRWLLNKISTMYRSDPPDRLLNVIGSPVVQDKVEDVSKHSAEKYPRLMNHLAVSSEEIQTLGIKNQFYGMLNRDLMNMIYNDEIENDHDVIMNYIRRNISKYAPNTQQKIKELTTKILKESDIDNSDLRGNKTDKYYNAANKIFKPNDEFNLDTLKSALQKQGYNYDQFVEYYIKQWDEYAINTYFYPKQIAQIKQLYNIQESTKTTKVTKTQLQEMVMKAKQSQLKRLEVYDMDSTLVGSPVPEFGRAEWKEKTGEDFPNAKAWWSVPESLDTTVFDIKAIAPVFNQMREGQRRPDTMVAVMTNRLDNLEREVRRVLKLNRINPDILSMAERAMENKGTRILQILKDNPTIKYVAFYDDQEKNIAEVRAALKGKGITYDLYNCQDGKIRRT